MSIPFYVISTLAVFIFSGLLAMAGLDLGSVWVAIYPHPEREARVREILNVPANLRVLCLLPVGHPAESKPPRTRYEASKVHHETFGGA